MRYASYSDDNDNLGTLWRVYPIRGHRVLPISVLRDAQRFAGVLKSTALF
jgi:hypothetical protein